jgi:hypothetical protein
MASRTFQLASLPVLLMLGTAAWAGRGDIDPNYGEGGRVATSSPRVLLALPDDRLVIADADAATEEGFRVRMVDATGQNVPSFGDGGVVVIDSLAAERTFSPEAAALAPNGDMIFAGSLWGTGARGLLRLDSDGQPVPSFGVRGDGFIEPAVTPSHVLALAVDPDGKIVLADGSWNPGADICGSPLRLQRLLADGQPDTGFGGGAIIEIPDLESCNGASVFGARADGGVIVGDDHTIVAFDAAGDIDLTFGVNGHLAISELAQGGALLMPDGGLLIFGSDTGTGRDMVFRKFDLNGQPDLDFGGGTGSIIVDFSAAFQEEPSRQESIGQLALDPDGEHLVAHLFLGASGPYPYNRVVCSGIVRLSIHGSPDDGFGRNGLTCLNITFGLIAVQSDGAPLFFAGDDNSIHRLLPDNSPSPGFLRVVEAYGSNFLSESGTATVATIERLAGRDGAVSVDYATGRDPRYPYCPCATAGSDYTAASGRLDWASGDDGQRTVTASDRVKYDCRHLRRRRGLDNVPSAGRRRRRRLGFLGDSTRVADLALDPSSAYALLLGSHHVASERIRGWPGLVPGRVRRRGFQRSPNRPPVRLCEHVDRRLHPIRSTPGRGRGELSRLPRHSLRRATRRRPAMASAGAAGKLAGRARRDGIRQHLPAS